MKILRPFNPFSKSYHTVKDFKPLSKRQKTIAVTCAFAGTILPLLGTTFAFRSVVGHYKRINQRALCEISLRRMYKNSLKAIREHADFASNYIDPSSQLSFEEFYRCENRPCSFRVTKHEEKGLRRKMEDASFCLEIPGGLLAGVCDGYGGVDVARFIQRCFPTLFKEKLLIHPFQIDLAFEATAKELQRQILNHEQWNAQGCTATVIYLEKATGLVYTMNVGDSEANIYRCKKGQWQSIPLSALRICISDKNVQRVNRIVPSLKGLQTCSKKRKSGYESGSIIAVSRAFGGYIYKPRLNSKSKITVQRVKSSDILLIATDGIKDFLSEEDIIELLKEKNENTAHLIVKKALEKGSSDNVTAIVVEIE